MEMSIKLFIVDEIAGTEVEMVVAVADGLLRADVVRLDRDAGMPRPLRHQLAAGEEIDEGWRGGFMGLLKQFWGCLSEGEWKGEFEGTK